MNNGTDSKVRTSQYGNGGIFSQFMSHNDEQTLTLYGHEITYNLWGKVSTIWHYDQTDFYYYTAEYGPDLEKVSSRYDKTYHIEYEKFQWGDYEEKTTDGVTTCFYFVNGITIKPY